MIEIEQSLAFKILDVLRTAPIYTLLHSPHQGELGYDFKPHKWEGFELEHAEKALEAHRELMHAMEGQVG